MTSTAQDAWTEEQWRTETIALRAALKELGLIVPECLIGEAEECDAPAAGHYATYLGLLRSRVELLHDNLDVNHRMMAVNVYADDLGSLLRQVQPT